MEQNATANCSDSELLGRFAATRSEEAFAEIVRRYSPLVLGACRRLLGATPDADDAAQAVFFTLAHKASSLRDLQVLTGWLHHVAVQVAYDLRRRNAARARHEKKAGTAMGYARSPDPSELTHKEELLRCLDTELEGLPAKYRLPLMLHYLQQQTKEDTARQLGANAGTISARLDRGRKLLCERLGRRGLALSVEMLGAALLQAGAQPAPSVAFGTAISKAAVLLAAGDQAANGLVSANSALLTQGALKMLFITKLKVAAFIVLGLTALGGVGVGTYAALAGEARPDVPKKEQNKDAKTPAPAPAAQRGTLIDLEVKDKPVTEVVECIIKQMGYEKLVVKGNTAAGQTISCSYKQRPAWECLVDIFERTGTTLGGGEIGADYAFVLAPGGKNPLVYQVREGVLVRIAQVAAGTATPEDDHHYRPIGLRICAEPKVSFEPATVAMSNQKDGSGKAIELIACEVMMGNPQLRILQQPNPWPGLSAVTLKLDGTFVSKRFDGEVGELAVGRKAETVKHDTTELFTLDGVADAGNSVRLKISFNSPSKDEGVMQGGWGFPVESSIEKIAGTRFELWGEGKHVSPIVFSYKGDGQRMRIELGFTRHLLKDAGGLNKTRLRFSHIVEKTPATLTFEFKDILGKPVQSKEALKKP